MGWLPAVILALGSQATELAPPDEALGVEVEIGDLQGFPWSHAVVGDLDGDGLRDLVLGATRSSAVHVHSARTGERLYMVREEEGAEFGRTLAALGDLDGDGAADFAASSASGVHLISGRSGARIDRIDPCGASGNSFGSFVVESIPDADGDGQAELALAHNEYHPRHPSWHLHVLSLPLCTELFRIEFASKVGPRLKGLPDLDGDGGGELMIDAPFAQVLSGGDGHLLFRFAAWDPGRSFTAWRAHSDAQRELVIGFPGALLFCSGKDGHPIRQMLTSPVDHLGISVVGGADVDGDHTEDLLIVWNQNTDTLEEGVIEVVSGRDGSVLTAVAGTHWDDLSWGAFLDDLDEDGTPDFVVGGNPLFAGPDPSARPARVYSGRTGELIYVLPESQFLP